MQFLWLRGDFKTRQNLQKTLFPQGLSYDKENGHYRTPTFNPIFDLTRSASACWEKQKSVPTKVGTLLVASPGIEPRSKV